MALERHKRAIGIFPNRPATASALQALRDTGFSMHDVSVITRDADEEGAIAGVYVEDSKGNSSGAGARKGAFAGGIVGGVAGALVGVGAVVIPGVAPALLVGEVAAVAATALAGGVVGAATGGFVGALIGLGVPRDRAAAYGERVSRGEYLVMLKGTERSLRRAEETLQRQGIQDWGMYDPYHRKPRSNGHKAPLNEPDNAPQPPHPVPGSHLSSPAVPESTSPLHPGPNAFRADSTNVDPEQANDRPTLDHPVAPNIHTASGYPDEAIAPPVMQGDHSDYEKRTVGVFADHSVLEHTLEALKQSGFPMHKISIVMRDLDRPYPSAATDSILHPDRDLPPVNYSASDSSDNSNNSNNIDQGIGRFANLMLGADRVDVPGLGTLLVIGAESGTLSSALSSSTMGSDTVVDGLCRLGIPKDRAQTYRDRLAQDAALLIIKAPKGETLQAASVLDRTGSQDWSIYDLR